jgi:transcriptional regulator with XRE-family HTH domain
MGDTRHLLGSYLAAVRKGTGISQETLAAEAGLSTSTLADIEQGKTRTKFTTLAAIIRLLDVDLDYLFEIITDQGPADPRRLALERRLITAGRKYPVEQLDLLVRMAEGAAPKADRAEE